MAPTPVVEPFPIALGSGKYLIFDVAVISHIRRAYRIGGVFIGSIPQLPQQNVFLGVPLQLMLEEAYFLVTRGHAYIADDLQRHRAVMENMTASKLQSIRSELKDGWREVALPIRQKAETRKKQHAQSRTKQPQLAANKTEKDEGNNDDCSEGALAEAKRDTSSPITTNVPVHNEGRVVWTPTTSDYLGLPKANFAKPQLPLLPESYQLFAYLHSNGYYVSPGLRFGCQYLAYPDDPLRYHSHFLATAIPADEEFDLLSLIGGGRLGTGVKKSYLLGAVERKKSNDDLEGYERTENIRVFSIEWSGM